MPRLPRKYGSTGIYHITLRGVDHQKLFLRDDDFVYFLNSLLRATTAGNAKVLAYCLMHNHIHLLLEEGSESVSETVKRFATSYAGHFNKKYMRVGPLYQSRFWSQAVEDDAYLLTVLLYIHFNPVKAGICERPEQYRWSSRWALTTSRSAVLNIGRLNELVPIEVLLAEEKTYDPAKTKELDLLGPNRPSNTWSDPEMWEMVIDIAPVTTGLEFRLLDNIIQRAAVRTWRATGISMRRIAQLTSYSRPIISQLCMPEPSS